MSAVELRFLGDFRVFRDGRPQQLPPSKKTRALLAYLSLNSRPFRREHLCELLWEIPDDPRGSLRWSLSKLRRLVDDERQPRIVADRMNVSVNTDGVTIDVVELRKLTGDELANLPLADLEAAAARFQGNFLEGLEFSDFHDFHGWCVAEREHALRDRILLLTELTERLAASPARALPYARSLVGLSPYDEAIRTTLIRLLNAAGYVAEAEQQYQLGVRMLKEAGVTPSGALYRARRRRDVDAPPPPRAEPVAGVQNRGRQTRALVGREEEIALITDAFDSAVGRGRAGLMFVSGAPGIGKSRLLESMLELAGERDGFVLRATAFESDVMRPFAMWIDSLRGQDSRDYDEIFGHTDVANRDRLFAGLSALAAREAAQRPVVLMFDDIQWCDDSSAAALHYVLRMNRAKPVLGIVAARDDELRDNAPVLQALRGLRRDRLLRELDLGPLPRNALAQLIAAQAPHCDAARLCRESAGNPLLAIELARAESEGAAGASLNELIRDRLSRFGVTGAEVIRWAAVLRPRFDVATIARASGVDPGEVGEALEIAERHSMLLATDRGLRFSHDLIAQAVYTDISPLRRQVMHRRIARLLEEDTALDLARASDLAHHAMQSRDPALTASAMVSASRLCLRFFANDDALSLAHKGLLAAGNLPDADRVRTQIDLHDILLSAGPIDDWETAANTYAALAEKALDHGALAHARLGYHMASYVRWAQGQWSEAREQSLQAERVIRGADNEAHIVGMAETAKCLAMLERDLSQADAMLMEAAGLAGRRRFSHHAIPAGRGMLRFHEDRLDDAADLFEEARTLCKTAGDRINEFQANEYLVMIELQRGRIDRAKTRCRQLVELGERIREGSEKPFAHALLGICEYAIDDDPAALDAALADLRIVDAKYRLAYALTRAALIDCERGRKQSAVARAGEALEYAKILERPTEMLLAHAVLACGHGTAGDETPAASHAAEVTRLQASAAAWTGELVARLSEQLAESA